jgi:hypothetical protein
MADFATVSFPFLSALRNIGNNITANAICRCHPENGDLCCFVNLAGHAFSSALVLVHIPDMIDNLSLLATQLPRVEEQIDGVVFNNSTNFLGAPAKACLESAQYLKEVSDSWNSYEWPTFHLFKTKPAVISKKQFQKTVGHLCRQLEFLNFTPDIKQKTKELFKAKKVFDSAKGKVAEWAQQFKILRDQLVRHIQDAPTATFGPERFISISDLSAKKAHNALRSYILEMATTSGIWAREFLRT